MYCWRGDAPSRSETVDAGAGMVLDQARQQRNPGADMGSIAVRVTKRAWEAEGILTFELAPLQNQPLPSFSAGSHVDVHIKPDLIRQYSLCNHPQEQDRYLIGVLRDPNSRGGSSAMHDEIREGDVLTVSEPRNHFPLKPGAKRSLLFAGGIGITPLLCMAEHLAQTGADFELHYCSRSLARTAFYRRLRQSPFAARVHFHFDDGATEQKLDLSSLTSPPADGAHIYICGPGGFIDHVLNAFKGRGWPDEQLHIERFAAQEPSNEDSGAFTVKIASTGNSYVIPPNKSIVDALAEYGIQIPVSCEQGVCGTCLTRVLDGTPDHRDLLLTDAERAKNDQLTPCCSRAKSAYLILDL
jgi:vanillate O-demethylase ferredoxin subunit